MSRFEPLYERKIDNLKYGHRDVLILGTVLHIFNTVYLQSTGHSKQHPQGLELEYTNSKVTLYSYWSVLNIFNFWPVYFDILNA